MPTIQPNFIAIIAATVTGFMLSYLWYSVLFAKAWRHEMGFSNDAEPTGAKLFKALLMTVIGVFLTVFVLGNNIQVWMPQSWGIDAPNLPIMEQALSACVFTWLGFYVPVQLNLVAWSKHSWRLFAINSSFYFVFLLISALLLLLV